MLDFTGIFRREMPGLKHEECWMPLSALHVRDEGAALPPLYIQHTHEPTEPSS